MYKVTAPENIQNKDRFAVRKKNKDLLTTTNKLQLIILL